jgi:hypothetical protein
MKGIGWVVRIGGIVPIRRIEQIPGCYLCEAQLHWCSWSMPRNPQLLFYTASCLPAFINLHLSIGVPHGAALI